MKQKPVATNWMCSSCGEDASCNCGAPLMSKAQRAVEAISRDPTKSDRAIAKEIGVGNKTVSRARQNSSVSDDTVDDVRTGLDGKQRKMPTRPALATQPLPFDEIDYGNEGNPQKPIHALLFNLDMARDLAREAVSYRGPITDDVMKLATRPR